MSSAPTAAEIARDARWLVQALDPAAGLVRLIEMDREAYRQSSFLDDRMLPAVVNPQLTQWSLVEAAIAPDARRDARWIFHIGHVGSTLISRLLGELDGVLSVREPRFLRDIAAIPRSERPRFTSAAQALFSRTFEAEELALVKATSFVSEIAPELVLSGERALFLSVGPRNYVASILAGEYSVQELRMRGPSRVQRMAERVVALPQARNDADLAAAAWACEMTSLEAAADAMPDRHLQWADFDRMLDDMTSTLPLVAAGLELSAPASQLQEIVEGPLMRRYSKSLEYDYSPSLRRELIADANRNFAREIDEALAMLNRAAEQSPLLARALARSGDH